ncbi:MULTISPECIES: MFS transporter [Providencia]|jgi:MFS family permease|uniref:MFS transporter n=1 Tax=Providencia TaxID=586 RepID=UPI001C5AA141|nr:MULTISPECIES: MFS transporter [Providencia]ELR5148976.1 MFS transporter [Providencia rettgeri]MDR2225416.1 MFS transporter [Providencia sp.]QXX84002.1 MFS transporter [Providencia sp. R33]
MNTLAKKFGFSAHTIIQLIFITANAQLLYAFWDLRNSLPLGFPVAMGITDAQAGQLYSMQGLVILLGTLALGWVGDRFKVRVIMLITTLGVGCISLFIALNSPGLSMPTLLLCFFSMLLLSEVLFKPANFKAVSLSTTKEHQGVAFGMFEFGRGLLAFLMSLLWAAMVYYEASSRTMMITSSIIVLATAILIFLAVPKDARVSEDADTVNSVKEALLGVLKVIKLPIVWVTGLNVFCIYGTFVAAGTYFARFLQAGYGASATVAAVFVSVVIALRMLPLLSTLLVTLAFKSTAHFMRFMSFILVILLAAIGTLFYMNPASITEFMAGQAPDNIISPVVRNTIMVLMLCASACCFMIRGVYYAPIGEFGIDKKHASAAMSLAITIGYLPALLAPLILGKIIFSPQLNEQGQVVKEILTPTNIIGNVFIGLSVLTLIAALLSWTVIKMKKSQ